MKKPLFLILLAFLLQSCHSRGLDRLLGQEEKKESEKVIVPASIPSPTPIETPTPTSEIKKSKDVYLLAGQSNMVRMSQYGLDAFKAEYKKLYNAEGVEFVPCAVGGTWAGQWLPGSGLLEDCVVAARGYDLTGILYYQGESDAYNQRTDWAENFGKTVEGFRHYYPDIPVVFAQIAINNDPLFDRGWNSIQNQQSSVFLPGVKMIKTYDLAQLVDDVHLTPDSLEKIAQRFAQNVVPQFK